MSEIVYYNACSMRYNAGLICAIEDNDLEEVKCIARQNEVNFTIDNEDFKIMRKFRETVGEKPLAEIGDTPLDVVEKVRQNYAMMIDSHIYDDWAKHVFAKNAEIRKHLKSLGATLRTSTHNDGNSDHDPEYAGSDADTEPFMPHLRL